MRIGAGVTLSAGGHKRSGCPGVPWFVCLVSWQKPESKQLLLQKAVIRWSAWGSAELQTGILAKSWRRSIHPASAVTAGLGAPAPAWFRSADSRPRAERGPGHQRQRPESQQFCWAGRVFPLDAAVPYPARLSNAPGLWFSPLLRSLGRRGEQPGAGGGRELEPVAVRSLRAVAVKHARLW